MPYSDQVLVLGPEGHLLRSGTFQSLRTLPSCFGGLDIDDSKIEVSTPVAKETTVTQSKVQTLMSTEKNEKEKEKVSTKSRGRRDPENLLYYVNTLGKWPFGLFLLLVTLQVIFAALQRK